LAQKIKINENFNKRMELGLLSPQRRELRVQY
jgi:hypothetical protein